MSRYKLYTRHSIADMLLLAPTEDDVHSLLLRCMRDLHPSAATKRKWMKRAETRLGQLRVQSIIRPDQKLAA